MHTPAARSRRRLGQRGRANLTGFLPAGVNRPFISTLRNSREDGETPRNLFPCWVSRRFSEGQPVHKSSKSQNRLASLPGVGREKLCVSRVPGRSVRGLVAANGVARRKEEFNSTAACKEKTLRALGVIEDIMTHSKSNPSWLAVAGYIRDRRWSHRCCGRHRSEYDRALRLLPNGRGSWFSRPEIFVSL